LAASLLPQEVASHFVVISADYKARQHDVQAEASTSMHGLPAAPKRVYDRSSAVLRLPQAAMRGVEGMVAVPNVIMVVGMSTEASGSPSEARKDQDAEYGEEDEDERYENEHDGDAEGRETVVAIEVEEDDAATDLALFDFSQFTDALTEHMDSLSPEEAEALNQNAGSNMLQSLGSSQSNFGLIPSAIDRLSMEEEKLRPLSLELYPKGKLPNWNDVFVPKDSLYGVRRHKVPPRTIFDINIVGTLRTLTTIGALDDKAHRERTKRNFAIPT
jgi:hypothetical protein